MSDSATLFRNFDFTMNQQAALAGSHSIPAGSVNKALLRGPPSAAGRARRLLCRCGEVACPDRVTSAIRDKISRKRMYQERRQAQEANPASFPSWGQVPPCTTMNSLTLRLWNDEERVAKMASALRSGPSSTAISEIPYRALERHDFPG